VSGLFCFYKSFYSSNADAFKPKFFARMTVLTNFSNFFCKTTFQFGNHTNYSNLGSIENERQRSRTTKARHSYELWRFISFFNFFFFFPEISVFHSDLRNCLRFVTDFCVQEVISPWSSRKAQRSAWVREMCWKSGLEAMGSRRFSDHGDQLERWKSTLLSTCGFPD